MLSIHPLSQVPTARDYCIKWSDAEWSALAGFSKDDWRQEFQRIEKDPVDEVFVALEGDTPVGMAWMLEQEGVESHTHLSPWLSSLIVDPLHRDKGVASALVQHVETYAALGGDDDLYLLTETPSYYFSMDWEVFDTAELPDRTVFVMKKSIRASADQD